MNTPPKVVPITTNPFRAAAIACRAAAQRLRAQAERWEEAQASVNGVPITTDPESVRRAIIQLQSQPPKGNYYDGHTCEE
jgi:hypothetical protein